MFYWSNAMDEEREMSIVFSVQRSLYTRLLLMVTSSSRDHYTSCGRLVKNLITCRDGRQLRTVQSDCGYSTECKTVLQEREHMAIYRHEASRLTLLLNVRDRISREKTTTLLAKDVVSYTQVVRDYIFCRRSGVRIAVERHFKDYSDPDAYQMSYDCFNRYRFECCIHIEYEYESCGCDTIFGCDASHCRALEKKTTRTTTPLQDFVSYICEDDIIFKLLLAMSNKNLNTVSDELVNIQHLPLVHRYSYGTDGAAKDIAYYSLKYDGVRENFCIFGRYLQIGRLCFEFKRHWFGQAIIGHCEIMKDGELILIDMYLVAENFQSIAKEYNISYTGALQNYHQFYQSAAMNSAAGPKTQDEYFHAKRLVNNIKFMQPLEAIRNFALLEQIWCNEEKMASCVQLQRFHTSGKSLKRALKLCSLRIDGCLAFTDDRIIKLKQNHTVDLVFKFDDMFRTICKRMKANQHDLKKITRLVNIQKTFDWLAFDRKYPGYFHRVFIEFLFFAKNVNFARQFGEWTAVIDLNVFGEQLERQTGTNFILLLEFDVDRLQKKLIFTRLRTDKFSANTLGVFKEILL